MTTDICTSKNPYWAAPNFFDTEQIALRRFDPPSYIGVPRHFDPYNPEKCFSGWSSKPGPPPPPFDPEYILWRDFSRTYPGDITKYVPFDPENFDPESFFFGGSSPSSAEPAEFDPSDPKLHPQDPKLLDNGFDDQFPANYAPLTSENYHLYGFSQTYPGDHTKYTPYDPENFDPESFFFGAKFEPCDPVQDPKLLDVSFDDQSTAKVDPVDPEIGVWDVYSPSYPGDPAKYFPFDPENFDDENFFSFGGLPAKSSEPCYPDLLDDRFDDQSPDLKAKQLIHVPLDFHSFE